MQRAKKSGVQSALLSTMTGAAGDAWRPENLTSFVNWAKGAYPATNYALFIAGHGGGWKGMLAMKQSNDNMNMDELRQAFAGINVNGTGVDVVGLENCLMGMVETAAQLQGYADYVIASEANRKLFTNWGGLLKALFKDVASPWSPRTFAEKALFHDSKLQTTLAAINMAKLPQFLVELDSLSSKLIEVCGETHDIDNRSDNGQVVLSEARAAAESGLYTDKNFVDIYDLMTEIRRSSRSELATAKPQALVVRKMLQKVHPESLFVARKGNSKNKGLTIYYPTYQSQWNGAHDAPLDDPRPTQAHLAAEFRYVENSNCTPVASPELHPLPALPNLKLVEDTRWGEFLERYYDPAAEAAIGFSLSGPWQKQVNVIIKEFTNVKFLITARGSSDIDQVDKVLQPEAWFWDNEIHANQDAFDADKDCDPTEVDDDAHDVGETVQQIMAVGHKGAKFWFTLNTWDDHDTIAGHTGHYQTDKDTTILIVDYKPDNPDEKKCIIDEIMITPLNTPDPGSEWFEVYNPDSVALNMDLWTISSGQNVHVIFYGPLLPVVIPPGEIAVFANTNYPLFKAGVDVLYFYGPNIIFDHNIGNITLRDADGVIQESVTWNTGAGWPNEPGSSIQWMGNGNNADATDWLAGGGPVFGTGDKGTPGGASYVFDLSTDVKAPEVTRTKLKQNYPNPFNPVTAIPFSLALNEHVTLNIYDVQGRVVRRLLNNMLPTGHYSPAWNGTNDHGTSVATGVYFYRLVTSSGIKQTRKMVLLK